MTKPCAGILGPVSDVDAVLLVSFGGPEGPDDVTPFLENVTRGRDVPPDRIAEVAATYDRFDGRSPLNDQCRQLRRALATELWDHGHDLPVYWGNRNWHPFLADAVAEMAADGVTRALALVTSAYSSFSGCRQYLDDIDAARATVGPAAPAIEKIRPYFDHPGFVEPFRDGVRTWIERLGAGTPLVFTAHSIPTAMAAGCDYETQLRATAALVAEAAPDSPMELVWQSRSGPSSAPWLEPDVNDHLRTLAVTGTERAIVVPVGFVSDHFEVVWDLDTRAAATAAGLGLTTRRVTTPGTGPDPRFVRMCRELVEERCRGGARRALSALPERMVPCAKGCCPAPRRPR